MKYSRNLHSAPQNPMLAGRFQPFLKDVTSLAVRLQESPVCVRVLLGLGVTLLCLDCKRSPGDQQERTYSARLIILLQLRAPAPPVSGAGWPTESVPVSWGRTCPPPASTPELAMHECSCVLIQKHVHLRELLWLLLKIFGYCKKPCLKIKQR